MPRRLTADTNVYISALHFGGIPETIVSLARAGLWEIAISAPILAEVERILSTKFHWASALLDEALQEVAAYTVRIEPSFTLDVVSADPSDNRILECAISANSDCIVTGDSHLLSIGEYAGVPILRPSEFLSWARLTRGGRNL